MRKMKCEGPFEKSDTHTQRERETIQRHPRAAAAAEAISIPYTQINTFRGGNCSDPPPSATTMARSLSQSKRFAVLVSDSLKNRNNPLLRRGFAAAVSDNTTRNPMVGKLEDASMSKKSSDPSWVPDPVTGYYRPINHGSEIDPAELRNMLLNHKMKPSH
ncbi:late embryogenesis abundant protein Lea5 [Senna tora]|uniref:Late embryogenesis abundant protein Lea5 n=1 Tax=Senna tora TaxID=362788 RepID=A0A835CCD6_9FABA|nr:late embryogenesis abundant protein Lea5 [Senna tora]